MSKVMEILKINGIDLFEFYWEKVYLDEETPVTFQFKEAGKKTKYFTKNFSLQNKGPVVYRWGIFNNESVETVQFFYIGQAKNFRQRLGNHFSNKEQGNKALRKSLKAYNNNNTTIFLHKLKFQDFEKSKELIPEQDPLKNIAFRIFVESSLVFFYSETAKGKLLNKSIEDITQ
jgi:hypothetical protein